MKFLVDMPLPPDLARWLAEQGHDAIHAATVGLDRASDPMILDYARRQDRVVVTADLDYPRLLALAGVAGPGLILFRGGDYAQRELIARLARALETIPPEELPSSIIIIEKTRIRRRRLPIDTNRA